MAITAKSLMPLIGRYKAFTVIWMLERYSISLSNGVCFFEYSGIIA